MSDGPHRSLNMRPGWKKLAERADKCAFDPDHVATFMPQAILEDWKHVPQPLMDALKKLFDNKKQSQLFEESRPERLDFLRRENAANPLAQLLISYSEQAIYEKKPYDFSEIASRALSTYAARCIWQVEEHYLRHPKSSKQRALRVRLHLEQAHQKQSWGKIAENLRSGLKHSLFKVPKKSGLDEGVRIR